MNILPRSYRPEEMDRGIGMRFHPCDSEIEPLDCMIFDQGKQLFVSFEEHVLQEENGKRFARIGDGKTYKGGDAFPKHWVLNPYTGEKLVRILQQS